MSKILFFSDIHGNMPAVYALEKEIEKLKPDLICFVGDMAGKGPEGDKAVDWVRTHCDRIVKGNWDDGLCHGFREKNREESPFSFYWKQLGEERISWIESLPFEDELLISGQWFRFVHGRPLDRLYQAYDDWAELEEGFVSKAKGKTYNAYICADSHMPYVRTCSKGYAINTGSVGNSLGIPRVHGVLIEGELGSLETAPFRIEILSIPYDNEEAIRVTENYPEMPNKEAYAKELRTGIYSRS